MGFFFNINLILYQVVLTLSKFNKYQ